MKRLLADGGLPGKGGKPLTALVHISLAELMARDTGSALQEQWVARARGAVGSRAGRRIGGGRGRQGVADGPGRCRGGL